MQVFGAFLEAFMCVDDAMSGYRSVLLPSDHFHQSLDAFDFRTGDHTMTEVKDEARVGAGLFENALCFDTGNLRRGGQCDGIEVALDGSSVADTTAPFTQSPLSLEAETGCPRPTFVICCVANNLSVPVHRSSLFKCSNDVANPAQ